MCRLLLARVDGIEEEKHSNCLTKVYMAEMYTYICLLNVHMFRIFKNFNR